MHPSIDAVFPAVFHDENEGRISHVPGNLAVVSQSTNAIKQYHPPGVLVLLLYGSIWADKDLRQQLLTLGRRLCFLEYIFLPGHTYNNLKARDKFIRSQEDPAGYIRAMHQAFRTGTISETSAEILSTRAPHTIFLQHVLRRRWIDMFELHVFGMQSQNLPAGCEKCLISPLPCKEFMDSVFPHPFQLTPRILSILRRISEIEGVGGYHYEKHWLVQDQYSFTHSQDNNPYSQLMRHPGILSRDLRTMIYRLQTQCNRRFDNESGLTEEIPLYCIHRSRMRRLRESVKDELDNPEVLDPFGLPPLRGSRNIFGPSICRRDHTRGFHTGYPMERRFAKDFDPVNDYDHQLCNLELNTWATNNSVRSMPREDWDNVKNQFDDIWFKSKAVGSISAGHFWDYKEDVREQDRLDFKTRSRLFCEVPG